MSNPTNQLVIATYNIQFCTNIQKVIENIEIMEKKGVTVFCLQEAINIRDREFIAHTITKKLGNEWKAASHVGEEISKVSIGTCIVWNSKVVSLEREEKIILPKIKKLAFHEFIFDKMIGGLAVPLQRRATSCYFKFQGKTILVTSIHTDNIGGTSHRLNQIQFLLSSLHKTNYEIICGDFNNFDLLNSGKEKNLIHKLLGNNFIEASKKVGWTADLHNIDMQNSFRLFKWFVKTCNIHLRRQLDYIWVKNFQVLKCYKLELLGSDHFPLICTLKID